MSNLCFLNISCPRNKGSVIWSLIFILELPFEKVCGDSNSPNTQSTTRRHVGKKNITVTDKENAVYAKYRPSYDPPNFNPLAVTGYLTKIRNAYPDGQYAL